VPEDAVGAAVHHHGACRGVVVELEPLRPRHANQVDRVAEQRQWMVPAGFRLGASSPRSPARPATHWLVTPDGLMCARDRPATWDRMRWTHRARDREHDRQSGDRRRGRACDRDCGIATLRQPRRTWPTAGGGGVPTNGCRCGRRTGAPVVLRWLGCGGRDGLRRADGSSRATARRVITSR